MAAHIIGCARATNEQDLTALGVPEDLAAVAVEPPKRDSFAGGVYANLGFPYMYGIFAERERFEAVAAGDRLTGGRREHSWLQSTLRSASV